MDNQEFDLDQESEKNLWEFKLQVEGWFNKENTLNYYVSLGEFEDGKTVIERKARNHIRNNLKNPTGPWITTEEILTSYIPELQHFFLRSITKLLEVDAYLNEFPLYDKAVLTDFRIQLYLVYLNTYIDSKLPSEDEISDYRDQWIIEEKKRVDRLTEIIGSANSIIYNDKIAYKAILRKYITGLEEQLLKIDERSSQKGGQPSYNELRNVFISEAAYVESLDALRKVKGPVISSENEFLLGERKKGALTAWVEVLKFRGKIKTISSSEMAKLLNKEIKGLNLYEDGITLTRTNTTAYKQYYKGLLNLII